MIEVATDFLKFTVFVVLVSACVAFWLATLYLAYDQIACWFWDVRGWLRRRRSQ